MSRTADALHAGRDRPGGSDLAHQIDRPDVDAELERGRRDERPQRAGLQLMFGDEPRLSRQAAVMCRDRVVAQPLREIVGDAFGQAPRVDENQGRSMLARKGRQPVIDLVPQLI